MNALSVRFPTYLTAILVSVAPSFSQTASDGFEVRVEVQESCTITADDLDFGAYDPNGLVPTIGTASVTANCTLLTVFDVGLDEGANGPSVSDRKMIDDATGAETLDYTLACVGVGVPGCLLNWGNTPGTDTFTSIGTGLPIPTLITGTIPAGQSITPGIYRDSPVTATVFF